MDGCIVNVLIDTGCATTLIGEHVVGGHSRIRSFVRLETVGRGYVSSFESVRLSSVVFCETQEELGPLDANVIKHSELPNGVDVILGLDAIQRTGLHLDIQESGLTVCFPLCKASRPTAVSAPAMSDSACEIEDCDFQAKFSGKWIVQWCWKESSVTGGCSSYPHNIVSQADEVACNAEIEEWVEDGILVKHDPQCHGEIKRYLPIIAVRQNKGQTFKVRPVMDFRGLNKLIESHPAGSTPVCAEVLREWRQFPPDCSIVDLRRAYLQIHMHRTLWPYQAVRWHGQDYLLTRLGFGLASAPKIMTLIVNKVLQQDPRVSKGVSGYIDDIYIREDVVSVAEVRSHLLQWGLTTKEPQRIGEADVRVLGLKIDERLSWRRDGAVPLAGESILTRRQIHKFLGECLGHFPVAAWLRVACAFLQRRLAREKYGWDETVSDQIMALVHEIWTRLKECDPVRGVWPVTPDAPITIWTDASSLAFGVVLEVEGQTIEDAAWLRQEEDSTHINRCELDAAIKGLNLALRWGKREMTLKTDSISVCKWLKSVIERSHNVRTRALAEVLIRRRLNIIRDIIHEEKLSVKVEWVPTSQNKADALTRVPSGWLKRREDAEVAIRDLERIHQLNHFGVDRTHELAVEHFGTDIPKERVKDVVRRCEPCARVDPARTFSWDRGTICSNSIWERLAVDITHVQNQVYLTAIDIASKFVIWRPLTDESAREVTQQMTQIFSEFGPPKSIMSDNGTVFRSRMVKELLDDWEVNHVLTCAYRSQGNSVVERSHRTVKRTVRRSGRPVSEATFWLNNTRGAGSSASPYELVFSATSRKPGITSERIEIVRPQLPISNSQTMYESLERNPFAVGERVYLRTSNGKCDDVWSGPHSITAIKSSVSVELNEDGIARHVSHLRPVPACRRDSTSSSGEFGVDVDLESGSASPQEDEGEAVPLRRSARTRRKPIWHGDYVMS